MLLFNNILYLQQLCQFTRNFSHVLIHKQSPVLLHTFRLSYLKETHNLESVIPLPVSQAELTQWRPLPSQVGFSVPPPLCRRNFVLSRRFTSRCYVANGCALGSFFPPMISCTLRSFTKGRAPKANNLLLIATR